MTIKLKEGWEEYKHHMLTEGSAKESDFKDVNDLQIGYAVGYAHGYVDNNLNLTDEEYDALSAAVAEFLGEDDDEVLNATIAGSRDEEAPKTD